MISAKRMSEAIRKRRKQLSNDSIEDGVDTEARPKMDANDIMLNKQTAQYREAMDTPEKNSAPSDPADEQLDDTQQTEKLKKRMSRTQAVFDKLKR